MSLTTSELEKLKVILLHMAENTKAIAKHTMSLISTSNLEDRKRLWKEIDDLSMILDKIRREFVTEVLVFIARRQPLGKELLSAHALISIAYDVYRISRYCREIARIDSLLAPVSAISTIQNISSIFKEALKALDAALNDLIDFSPKRIAIVNEADEHVDKEYQEILREITTSDVVPREKAVKALLMRHIERIVDHAQYIEQHLSEVV